MEDEFAIGRIAHGGTCQYKSGLFSRWKTFDQVIVSRGLIAESPWRLVQRETAIRPFTDVLVNRAGNTKKYFDHLPIVTAVTYNGEEDDG